MSQQLEIDASTVFDNLDERQVEFDGEVDGEEYQFAVQYSVLEALTGDEPDGDAENSFHQHLDTIREAALSALSNGPDRSMIVISEGDLDQ
jgi:hypothetical protein